MWSELELGEVEEAAMSPGGSSSSSSSSWSCRTIGWEASVFSLMGLYRPAG